MEKKIKERLERRFLILPLHQIDTDIILEPENTENGRYCKRYLNKVGYRYRGFLSFPVLSELFLKILKLETFDEKWDTLHLVDSLIKEKKILFYSQKDIREIETKIIEIDKRIQPLDREITACATEQRATLVTIDSDLYENYKLQEKLDIQIKHPKELI